jgi:hypothetical protein
MLFRTLCSIEFQGSCSGNLNLRRSENCIFLICGQYAFCRSLIHASLDVRGHKKQVFPAAGVIEKDVKVNIIIFILIWHCNRATKNSLARAGFELASTGIGSESLIIQFKCTKYFRDDLTLVLEDAQCFNSISEPSSEIRKTSFILINKFFVARLQCQINMKLVFRISEDGSEISIIMFRTFPCPKYFDNTRNRT